MKHTIRTISLTIAAFLLGSCATSYGPRADYAGIPIGGYTNERIDENTMIVGFDANGFTSARKIQTFLLYRCAEVTIHNGYQYFIIVSSSILPVNNNIVTSTSYRKVSNTPRLYNTYYRNQTYQANNYALTDTLRYYDPAPQAQANIHAATAVIKMFAGPKPPGALNAFNALDVIAHLQPQTY